MVSIPQLRIAPDVISTADPLTSAVIPPSETLSGPQVTAVVAPPADYARNLQLHNSYRARHQNTPAMQWDDVVARSAQDYANKCIWGHDQANNAYGENLYVTSSYSDATKITQQEAGIKGWYDEISLYNYNSPGWTPGAGHFTQVWLGGLP
jgi:uncharacterized protein YkwD